MVMMRVLIKSDGDNEDYDKKVTVKCVDKK